MIKTDRPTGIQSAPPAKWGSDVAAAAIRGLGIKYVTLNPGASFRGFHDSLVNYLGNDAPAMLLCLHEDHVISIAHGYAKVTDEPMAAVLHSNVGLMHGAMGLFNAFCDRAPMLVIGATGPVDATLRRPWIDWIHTAKDQAALVRDFIKWDDEPRSAGAMVESIKRAYQMTSSEPRAPVYVCLDAGLQEQKVDASKFNFSMDRFQAASPPHASADATEKVHAMIRAAKRPVFLFGRGSRAQSSWDRRVQLVESTGATVLTSIRERAIFPTTHPNHPIPPNYWLRPAAKELLREADLIVSFDQVDLAGTLEQVFEKGGDVPARVVHVSLDSQLHRGWCMDYFGLPPTDVNIHASPDTFVGDLLAFDIALGDKCEPIAVKERSPAPLLFSEKSGTEIAPRDIEVALQLSRVGKSVTLAHVTYGWAGDAFQFEGPLDFLGNDAGAGLAAGPGLSVGAGLALADSGRIVVSVMGDGDFLQGATALWTAARHQIPVLIIVSNNRSNFNDELHQEAVAKVRGRPVENRWIGQRIDDPAIDLCGLAKAQGIVHAEMATTVSELQVAIAKGMEVVANGAPYFIDARVSQGYAMPPLARG